MSINISFPERNYLCLFIMHLLGFSIVLGTLAFKNKVQLLFQSLNVGRKPTFDK